MNRHRNRSFIETLESRTLMSGAGNNAAVVQDRAIISADTSKIRFDRLQLRQVTVTDDRNALATTAGIRAGIRTDLQQLHADQRKAPANVVADLVALQSAENTLATTLRTLNDSVRTDHQNVLFQIAADEATLKADRKQLRIDLK